MPRQNLSMNLLPGKIRKRGCSSSASSSSSIIQNYRFKRAILVGKRTGSCTPVPTWRLLSSRSRSPASAFRTMDSPKYTPSKQAPVSARKLAATLWEMNELPSPRRKKEGLGLDERRLKKEIRVREKVAGSVHSGYLPPHLSDPSHSPVSERIDHSGTGSRFRRTPSVSEKLKLTDHDDRVLDSIRNASLMEIESRSRTQTTASTVGVKTRLKSVSTALTTSKELLKIINRMWGREERPSSSLSLISALHAELERARLQINELIQEQRSDQDDMNYLMKRFAEEKAAWKSKEEQVIEAAIESITGELEVERKLRRRSESLNKKLGRELAETNSSLLKVVKELEREKRAREIVEQVCDELSRDIGEDKAEVEELQRESAKVSEEVLKERDMMHLANVLREERAQMDISEAKYQFEEKNAAVDKLRKQLETFLGNKRAKDKERGSNHLNDEEIAAYLSRNHFGLNQKDEGEVEDGVAFEDDSVESDLHSIELSPGKNNLSYNWVHGSGVCRDSRRPSIEEEIKGRKSLSGKVSRKSTSIQRSISDGVEWGIQDERLPSSDVLERISALEKHGPGKLCGDEMQGYKSAKSLRDQILSGSKLGSARVNASPTRQWGQPWPSRDPSNTNSVQDRSSVMQSSGLKPRLVEVRGEGPNARKSKR